MKLKLFFLIYAFANLTSYAQDSLSYVNNHLRIGDNLTKKQIEYVPCGRSGENVLWNLGEISISNEKYNLKYKQLGIHDNNITGIEHLTKYIYNQTKEKVELIGYENNYITVTLSNPEIISNYPMRYGDSIQSFFQGYASTSEPRYIYIVGNSKTAIDGVGKIILPNCDTLQNVIRLHTIKEQALLPLENIISEKDFIENRDSMFYTQNEIAQLLNENLNKITTETFRWFVAGYRYPILESIVSKNDSIDYTTSFYYPPEEQSYEQNDNENEIIRTLLLTNKNIGGTASQIPNFSYNVYLTNGGQELLIEYDLNSTAKLAFGVYTIDGKTFFQTQEKNTEAGFHSYRIPTNSNYNLYIITFYVDGKPYSSKVTN